jgi:cobalt-precorrin-5B (C1)-methyltransferase
LELKKFTGGKFMRYGYTTGTCAAGAAKAAAELLLGGNKVENLKFLTPKGIEVDLDILDIRQDTDFVSCAVRKDGGDDPDATNGILIYAKVERSEKDITIDGGTGVGRVTKPGLDQPVGNAAINSVPRKMITEAIKEVCAKYGYSGGVNVIVSAKNGEEIGAKTFNPYLGIVGGISILGTSGIVEPMSSRALIDSTRAEMSVLKESGVSDLLLTIGNYGDKFASKNLGLDITKRIKTSNFIGDALDDAVALGFKSVLLIGHIGKMVKLGAGIMNTHSSQGDARMEIMLACALEAGADISVLRDIMTCPTTDGVLEILDKYGKLEESMSVLKNRIEKYLNRKLGDYLTYGAIVFTDNENRAGVLCTCGEAGRLLENWRHYGN